MRMVQSVLLCACICKLPSVLGRFTLPIAACGYSVPHPHIHMMTEVKQRIFFFLKDPQQDFFVALGHVRIHEMVTLQMLTCTFLPLFPLSGIKPETSK